ncbi:MAG: LruC domain-containing protein [Bacteroidales bacterium]|nr:LruC domain-containing protein [Bacteroidales bacterium]
MAVSCNDDYEAIDSDPTKLDTNFTFSTRKEITIDLLALNPLGEKSENVLVSIYSESPYKEISNESDDADLKSDVSPVYSGYTDAAGKLTKKISISSSTSKLYIVPVTLGFGSMKEVTISELGKEIVLQGKTAVLNTGVNSTKASNEIFRDQISVGRNYKFYHYFNESELNVSDGSLNLNSGVVSYEKLSPEFLNYIDHYFPEKEQNYSGDEEDTDFKITDENGAEIWITYIGDGGFTNKNPKVCNGLYYYSYTDSNIPDKSYSANYIAKSDYALTAIFPNVNPGYIVPGTRVQLLYYNKETGKYQSTFPKGSYVGFALNHMGYNYNNTVNDILGFSLAQTNNNPSCTTKKFNSDKKTHGIIHWDISHSCYILGMERKGDDNDFNDLVVKITSNPIRLGQVGSVDPVDNNEISYSREGTLAFEDNWPQKGDYDFNDFVTNYKYSFVKSESSNNITAIVLSFKVAAIGTASTNGFGIQIPLNRNLISNASDFNIEEDNGKSTLIIYNNVRESYNNAGGIINASKGSGTKEGTEKTIRLELTMPIHESSILFDDLNPFLFVQNREREIHLVDYKPTSKMDMSLFGTKDDKSSVENNVFYRMDNQKPWALDICDKNWRWPYENLSNGIELAYPKFVSWYTEWKKGDVVNWTGEAKEEYLW